MTNKIGGVTCNAYNRVSRQRGITRYPTRLGHQGPFLLGANADHVRLRNRRQMELRGVLNVEGVRNERHDSIHPTQLGPPTLPRRVVDGGKAIGWPSRSSHRRFG